MRAGPSRLVLLAVLGSLTLLWPTSSEAAFPGANGKIAFVSNRDVLDEIYTMEPNGSGVTRLTNNLVSDGSPRWSADGSMIVFERDVGDDDVFTMTSTGSTQTNVTNHPASDWNPAWSPDGTQIVFASSRDGTFDIYVMQADGSDVTQLTFETSEEALFPTWSPDGLRIAFVKNFSGNHELFVMNTDGSGQRRLTRNEFADLSPNWSPDGRRLVFTRCDFDGFCQLFTMRVGRRREQALTDGPFELSPAWSPDGLKVVFTGSGFEIFTMNLDGTDLVNVTNNGAIDQQPDWQPIP